jgi:hypothetical protein
VQSGRRPRQFGSVAPCLEEGADADCCTTCPLRSPLGRRTQLKDVGKGWYSLAEAQQDTYNFSKLKRLLVCTAVWAGTAGHPPHRIRAVLCRTCWILMS